MSNDLPESIGNIDASIDDVLNEETFVQNKYYSEILKKENFLITGRKGVGKTALARMIPEREKENWNHIYSAGSPRVFFQDIESDFLSHGMLSKMSIPAFMNQMWEHFILENIMKIILKYESESPYIGDRVEIYNYLKSINQAEIDTISTISKFFTDMVELLSNGFEQFGLTLKSETLGKIKEHYKNSYKYDRAKQALYNILLNENIDILFLIDDLDENLTKRSKQDMVEAFIGELIKVVININHYFINSSSNKEDKPALMIKIFLPTDIYSWLSFRHDDKYKSNRYELSWSDEELKTMLYKRLNVLCNLGNISFSDMMDKYFGKYIYDTHGNQRPIFSYMVSNTFKRPRDIMNLYKKLSKVLAKNKDLQTLVAYEAIEEYIYDTIETLKKEYSFTHPNLSDILSSFTKANIICNWEYIRVRVADKTMHLNENNIDSTIKTLYEISLFGVLKVNKLNYRPMSSINESVFNIPLLHSIPVEYCYDRWIDSLKNKPIFMMHPIFAYEYAMQNNSKKFLQEYIKQTKGKN